MIRRIAALCALLLVFLSLGAGAAQAESWLRKDAVGDVSVVNAATGKYKIDSSIRQGDIKATRVKYGANAVHISIAYRELLRKGGIAMHSVGLRAGAKDYSLDILAGPGMWRGEHIFSSGDMLGDEIDPDSIPTFDCPGITHSIDYDRNVVRAMVPARCLGTPRSIRVGPLGMRIATDFSRAWIDSALGRGLDFTQVTPWSIRIFRG